MDIPPPKPGTYLSFDFGTKKMGVAVGQTLTGNAQPLAPIKMHDGIPSWAFLQSLLNEWQPTGCIVGLPLNMDGSDQELTIRARKFAKRLHGRFGMAVYFQDERLTSVEARRDIFEEGGYRAVESQSIDSRAAALIFEDWHRETPLQ